MSTTASLELAIEKGNLCHLTPALGQPASRTMLLHPELAQLFDEHARIRSIGAMRGYLESFVIGNAVTMGLMPYAHGTATMGRLDPILGGTWDFRCRDPSPATRVFGGFAHRDVFVAMYWAPRSKMIPGIDRAPLGDAGSLEYHIALGETEKRWSEILPTVKPLIGSKWSDYLSENATSV